MMQAISPASDRIAAEVGPDRALLDDVERRRQRAGAQQHREVLGRLRP